VPVVKLHLSATLEPVICRALADQVRETVVKCLEIDPRFGKVILYQTPRYCRSVHPDRDPDFALAEVLMFKGRSQEVKNRLFQELARVIARHTSLSPPNIFIDLIESQRSDWGIRGGQPADQVDLGY